MKKIIFPIFAEFGESPIAKKYFFANLFFFDALFCRRLSTFFDGTGGKWKMTRFGTYLWRERLIFRPPGPTIPRNIKVCCMIRHFGEFPGPLGRNVNFLFKAMYQIESSFICHQSCQKMLRDGEKKLGKKKFSRSGIPWIRQKSIFFFIFWRKMPKKHFKTKMGRFGRKIEVWRL